MTGETATGEGFVSTDDQASLQSLPQHPTGQAIASQPSDLNESLAIFDIDADILQIARRFMKQFVDAGRMIYITDMLQIQPWWL